MMKDRKDVAIIVQSCQIWITYIKKHSTWALDRGTKATKLSSLTTHQKSTQQQTNSKQEIWQTRIV
jgi:hypothetical protein